MISLETIQKNRTIDKKKNAIKKLHNDITKFKLRIHTLSNMKQVFLVKHIDDMVKKINILHEEIKELEE